MAISLVCLQMVCQRGPLAPPQDPVGESSPFRAITSIYGPAFERNVAKLAKFIKDKQTSSEPVGTSHLCRVEV
jgi:hypothetical protein